MLIKLKSNIPYLLKLNGDYVIEDGTRIIDFLTSLGVKWDEDALVVINDKISSGNEVLINNDRIQLLLPIAGG